MIKVSVLYPNGDGKNLIWIITATNIYHWLKGY